MNGRQRVRIVVLFVFLVLMQVSTLVGAESVSEHIGTITEDATGSVVSLGLSNYNGLVFSITGGIYTAATAGSPAQIINAAQGNKYGHGAKLQYSLYNADDVSETFKISAQTNDVGDGKVLVGVYRISDAPSSGDRQSGHLGDINRADAYYNGFSPAAGTRLYDQVLPDEVPAMFLLYEDSPVDIIVNIDADDTWTGTTSEDGASLFYELLEPLTVRIYFTIAPQ